MHECFKVIDGATGLSPLLFSMYLSDINETSEGIEGACTGAPNLCVPHLSTGTKLNLHSAAKGALKLCLAGSHASQMQATPYPSQGLEMNNCIQKWSLGFLKSLLGIRTPTPPSSVLH
eukprot:scaffold193894_cov20-Tisochrysis_lutea.AAC.2